VSLAHVQRSSTELARAIAAQCNPKRLPVCVAGWYSDGLCTQVGAHCEPARPKEWESVILEAVQAALARGHDGSSRAVCLTVWFSDSTCIQRGLSAATEPPTSREADEHVQCKRDITTVLQEAGRRLTTTEILRTLEARQLLWGESTVKRALAEMVREEELTNQRDIRPRGYGLPNWT